MSEEIKTDELIKEAPSSLERGEAVVARIDAAEKRMREFEDRFTEDKLSGKSTFVPHKSEEENFQDKAQKMADEITGAF